MIRSRAALLGAAIAVGLAASAAAAPHDPGADFWALNAPLPESPRIEGRLLRTDDQEGADAAIVVWMEEHGGVTTNPARFQQPASRKSWLVPITELQGLDEMLRHYGRVVRRAPRPFGESREPGPSRDEKNPAVRPLIDAKAVAARRDALQNELDALRVRESRIPNIVLLASSFAATLDKIVEARERYDAIVIADIEITDTKTRPEELVPGIHGPTNINTVSSPLKFLPDSYGLNPGAVRIPGFGDREADYLTWIPLASNIDEMATLKISVIADKPDKTFKLLEAELFKLGAESTPLKPLPSSAGSRNVYVDNTLYPALPLAGYLVSRKDLKLVRTVVNMNGQLAAWTAHAPVWKDTFRGAVDWDRALAAELRGEKDRLASFPQVRSLLADQLRRLHVFAEILAPFPKSEFVALEVLEKQSHSPQAAAVAKASAPPAPPAVPPPPPPPSGARALPMNAVASPNFIRPPEPPPTNRTLEKKGPKHYTGNVAP